jgi:hypothetical protein
MQNTDGAVEAASHACHTAYLRLRGYRSADPDRNEASRRMAQRLRRPNAAEP